MLVASSLFLNSERFRHLLKTQNVHLSMWEGWKLFLIGHFFNYVLPGGVGGDVVKAYYLKKENGADSHTSPYTVIFDRFIGLYVLMGLALVATLIQMTHGEPRVVSLGVFVLAIFVALTFLTYAVFNASIRETLHGLIPKRWGKTHTTLSSFFQSFEFYALQPSKIFYGVLLTLIAQTLTVLCLYYVGRVAGSEQAPLMAYFFVVPLGLALSALPIAPPGGVGVGQAAFLFLFNIYLGHSTSLGPTVISIFQISCIIVSLGGFYFYIARKKAS